MSAYAISEITEADFSRMRDEWDTLLSSSASDNVFLTWEWLFTWWRHFKNPGRVLKVVCARDDRGRLKGILPLYHEAGKALGAGGALRFLGTGAACSEYLDLIVERGQERELVDALVRYASTTWTSCPMRLTDLPAGSGTLKRLERALEAAGIRFFPEEGAICPFLRLPAEASGFSASLKPKMRSNYKRSVAKFRDSFGTRTRRAEGSGSLRSAYDTLFALHKARFEGKGEKSSFLSEEMWDFHLDVGKAFLEKGWLRFFVLETGDRVVGSLYCFAYGDRMSYYQAGFDPEYESWSVGLMLVGGAIEDAIAHGMKEFDFLRGAEQYKWAWTNTYRRTAGLTVYPRTLGGALQSRYDSWRRSTARSVKRLAGKGAGPSPTEGRQLVDSAGGEA